MLPEGNPQPEPQAPPQPNVGGNVMDPMWATWMQDLIQAIMAGVGHAANRPPPAEIPPIQPGGRDPLESFQKRNPKVFSGTPGAGKPEDWLENMEKIFGTMICTETQKVAFATFVLEGEASQWWKAEKRSAEQKGITEYTWVMFVEAFNKKYFPPSVRERKMVDFLELVQGDMTVDEYDARFVELSRYAPAFFENETQKARKFERGLHPRIGYRLTALNLPTYAEVLDRARLVEQESAEFKKRKDEKRKGVEDGSARTRNQAGYQGNNSNNSNKRRAIDNTNRGGFQPNRNLNPSSHQNQGTNAI